MTTIDQIKAECRRAIELSDSATPGPWKTCAAHNGECSCRSVWSVPADMPVCECNSSWGDGAEGTDTWIEYGSLGEAAKQANKSHIAHARTFTKPAAQAILTVLDRLEANGPHGLNYSPECQCWGCVTLGGIRAAFTPAANHSESK